MPPFVAGRSPQRQARTNSQVGPKKKEIAGEQTTHISFDAFRFCLEGVPIIWHGSFVSRNFVRHTVRKPMNGREFISKVRKLAGRKRYRGQI